MISSSTPSLQFPVRWVLLDYYSVTLGCHHHFPSERVSWDVPRRWAGNQLVAFPRTWARNFPNRSNTPSNSHVPIL